MMSKDILITTYSGKPACGGNHYEIYGGVKTPDEEGWTYSQCESCGYKWRTRTVSEEL